MNNVKVLLTVGISAMMLIVGLFLTVGMAQAGGGNALNLKGNGYVAVSAADNGPLTFASPGGDFTLEAWVRPDASGSRTIFCNGHGSTGSLTNYIFQINNVSPGLSLYIDEDWRRDSTNSVPLNVWSHVAVVFDENGDNDSITFYLNGVQGNTITGSFTLDAPPDDSPAGDFHIGDQNRASGNKFSGDIDEARVWATARTPVEIQSMHKTLGAVGAGYWKFDDSLTFDSSPNELPGTSSNATSVPSTAPIASDTVANKTDMQVIWRIGGGQKASAQLDVDAGALSDPNYAIFAHNNGGLTPNTDNKPDVIDRRWNRVWTFDMYGTVTATFTFTVPPGQITNKESMVLLESNSDTDFSGATSVGTRVTGVPNTTMQFTNVSIADGKSYTIGSITSDNPLPVQLSVFTATDTMDGVLISWRTESELDNLGFNIYRSDTEDGKYTRVNARMIQGAGTDANSHDYSFTDDNVVFGKTYFYYLENIDIDGSKSKSEIIKVVTPEFLEPKEFRLMQNYPNPFNPDTWFPYELPTDTTVIIRIYDVNGHLVRHLDLGKQKAGSYIYKEKAAYWDGTDQTGKSVSSGLYFYTLEAGDFRATKRMVILK